MDDGMKDLVLLVKLEGSRKKEKKMTKDEFLTHHVYTLREKAQDGGLTGLIAYAATHPIRKDVFGQVEKETLDILGKLKPKVTEWAKFLTADNIEIAGTAVYYLCKLLDREAVDKKELREDAGIAKALRQMNKRGDEEFKMLAGILEQRIGTMESTDKKKFPKKQTEIGGRQAKRKLPLG